MSSEKVAWFLVLALVISLVSVMSVKDKECVVNSCPNQDGVGSVAGTSVTSFNCPVFSCSECLPHCTKELNAFAEMYTATRGLGSMVALREGLK